MADIDTPDLCRCSKNSTPESFPAVAAALSQTRRWRWSMPKAKKQVGMIPIILPTGTECRWQYASAQDDAAIWDDLARELLRAASAERRVRIKDDILLLVLVACDRAMQADPAAFAMMARIEREAA